MNFLKSNPDFLIIGGGIFGCFIAWNPSKRSSGRVLLLERRELASAKTPRAAVPESGHPEVLGVRLQNWPLEVKQDLISKVSGQIVLDSSTLSVLSGCSGVQTPVQTKAEFRGYAPF